MAFMYCLSLKLIVSDTHQEGCFPSHIMSITQRAVTCFTGVLRLLNLSTVFIRLPTCTGYGKHPDFGSRVLWHHICIQSLIWSCTRWCGSIGAWRFHGRETTCKPRSSFVNQPKPKFDVCASKGKILPQHDPKGPTTKRRSRCDLAGSRLEGSFLV